MITIDNIRNYKSIVKRGLITDKTKFTDFCWKLEEEIAELTDVILVAVNMAEHLNIDIEKAIKEKIIINENR